MAECYEVVIFTAALQDYADWAIEQVDPNAHNIKFKLYRQHAIPWGTVFVKVNIQIY
jgi:TFIIF-interacting CTD phosphatase-like protein